MASGDDGEQAGARVGARLVPCATALSILLAASGAGASPPLSDRLCDACMGACDAPLSHEDALLDAATDSYTPDAEREIATAAAIEMAAELKRLHLADPAGSFGAGYEAHASDIESLAAKDAASDHATSAEIRSLKRVRTALFADTVAGLQALAADPPSPEFLSAYRANAAVLEGVIASLSSEQQMRDAERRAVCEVLARVPRADRPASDDATSAPDPGAGRPPG